MTALIPALLTTTLCLGPVSDPQVPRGQGVWPLSPRPEVVQGFDAPDSPWGSGHRGVDLAGTPGQPVLAALGGQVTFAGRLAGRGVIVVSHGPTRTTYEPVTATVTVGDLVPAGGVLGVLDTTLSHCAPAACLHWGWRRGEAYLDPLDLVGAGKVRLLPLQGSNLLATPLPTTPAGAEPAGVAGAGAAAGAATARLSPRPITPQRVDRAG